MEMKKYKLGEVLNFYNGKQRPNAGKKYPVYGGNGIIGYSDDFNYENNIIIGRVGANCGSIQKCLEKCWVSDNAISVTVKNNFDKEYIYNLLKSMNLNVKHVGAAQPLITQGILSELIVKIPSYEEQKKNSGVLSSLDDKIALNNRINVKLEQMAKRLYDYWFVQFDFPRSVSGKPCLHELSRTDDGNARSDFPGADGKPYKSNGGKMVWNEELQREIPEGWEVKKLGDLFTTNRGVSYSTATITGDGGIPMINLASFSPDGCYKVSGLKLFTGEYTKEKVLKPYDLVLCNTQQTAIDFTKDIIGKVLLIPDIFEGDITSSHHVNTLHVSNEDLKFYLYRLCNTDYFHKYISNYASGTNILGLDFSGVENFKTEIPPAELLAEFAKLMLNIEKKKSEVIKENQKLIAMRDKLLPLLMNGQVVVR